MVAHFSASFWGVRHGHIYIYVCVCVYSSSLNDIVLLGKFSPKSCYPGASFPGLSAEVGKELDTAIELWNERCRAMELPLRHLWLIYGKSMVNLWIIMVNNA